MELETRNQKPKSKRREQIILYAPLIIWIGVIFFLSSGQGSLTRTSIIIRPILEFLFPASTEETLQLYHGLIRKCAHLTEYAVLGFLAYRALAVSITRHVFVFVLAMALIILVSISDEFNQKFNAERTSSPYDVLIDIVGGGLAVILSLLRTWRRDRMQRPN